MARLNIQERIFIVETMNLTKSVTETQRKFNTKFGHKVSHTTILRNVDKWKKLGSVQDCHKGNSGRKKSARSPENTEKVNLLVQSNCKTSIRRISSASGISQTSVHRIVKKDLRLKPYKPQISQELKEGDDTKRLDFCKRIEEMIHDNEFDPGDIIFSDESHVYLHSVPDKQNNRQWCLSRPENRTSVPLHSAKVTVWCGLNSTKIFGPYFFEDSETGLPLTVTKERYTKMLMEIFPEDSEEVNSQSIFMQDGHFQTGNGMATKSLSGKIDIKQV